LRNQAEEPVPHPVEALCLMTGMPDTTLHGSKDRTGAWPKANVRVPSDSTLVSRARLQ
jgi:hypothetical protein